MSLSFESANRQADHIVDNILQYLQRELESDNFCAELCEADREKFERDYINAKLRAWLSEHEECSPSGSASNSTNTPLQTSSEVKRRSDTYIRPQRFGTPPPPRSPSSETTGTSPSSALSSASTRLQRRAPLPPAGGSHCDHGSQSVGEVVPVPPQPTRQSSDRSRSITGLSSSAVDSESLASGPATTSASSSLSHYDQSNMLDAEIVKDEQVPNQGRRGKWQVGDDSTRVNYVEISSSNINGFMMNNGATNLNSNTFRAVNHKMPLPRSSKRTARN